MNSLDPISNTQKSPGLAHVHQNSLAEGDVDVTLCGWPQLKGWKVRATNCESFVTLFFLLQDSQAKVLKNWWWWTDFPDSIFFEWIRVMRKKGEWFSTKHWVHQAKVWGWHNSRSEGVSSTLVPKWRKKIPQILIENGAGMMCRSCRQFVVALDGQAPSACDCEHLICEPSPKTTHNWLEWFRSSSG